MSPGEIASLKEKIKQAMIEHLKSTVNYPDCTGQEIMNQLKPMWIALEEKNLIVEGMSFQAFCACASQAFTFDEIRNIMGF